MPKTAIATQPGAGRRGPARLILTLSMSFAALAVVGWSLGQLVVVGRDRQTQTAVDGPVERFFVHHRSPWLTHLMRGVTNLGSSRVLVPLVIAVGALLWRRRRTARPFLALVATWAGAVSLQLIVKALVGRPRPRIGALVSASGSAFPSGHATQAAAVYVMLAAVVAPRTRSRAARVGVWTVSSIIVGTVAISRLYLGVHWLTDVVGGLLLGTLWAVALLAASATGRGRDAARGP